jgi:hypothetical protein
MRISPRCCCPRRKQLSRCLIRRGIDTIDVATTFSNQQLTLPCLRQTGTNTVDNLKWCGTHTIQSLYMSSSASTSIAKAASTDRISYSTKSTIGILRELSLYLKCCMRRCGRAHTQGQQDDTLPRLTRLPAQADGTECQKAL